MVKRVEDVPASIYALAEGRIPKTVEHMAVAGASFDKWFEERKERRPHTIHFSEYGDPCKRRLWYKVNEPDTGKPDGKAIVKFFYGDMLENLVLTTAAYAGHDVQHQQARLEYDIKGTPWKLTGRIDAVIDGTMVDVKSVTKNSEEKFKGGLADDPFGYYQQLNGYAVAAGYVDAGFLTIQKELGHINYYPIVVDAGVFQRDAFDAVNVVSASSATMWDPLPPVKMSATSKNEKLCVTCSYCPFKKRCFPRVRTFLYFTGPVYLTKVVDAPRVLEVTE